MVGDTFIKGNLKGRLLTVLQETGGPSTGYKWVQVLTLVDEQGRWLTPCQTYRSNHFKKAERDFIAR